MAKKKKKVAAKASAPASSMTPLVAAELAGVIYRAKLENRAAKLNISEAAVVTEVIQIWRTVAEQLSQK
jgi:hypothetical protein